MPNEITNAAARSAKATKTLDTMRARIVKANEARAAQVAAAEAWDALATHAATQTAECRHGATARAAGGRARRAVSPWNVPPWVGALRR